MCGICGTIYLHEPRPVLPETLSAMADAIRHRGPDDEGFHTEPGLGLGMRRLSIIDLDHGHQPIYNDDESCCIVYNGEIYNYTELRHELVQAGFHFRTQSDTEVVLRAYEHWGIGFLRRLNGMFAFAIRDRRRDHLLLGRDRIGEKPLYYYRAPDRIVFASEIKAILADRTVPREINPRGLSNFLAFGHAVAPDTIYRDIYKVLPGHYLLISNGQIEEDAYWDVSPELPASSYKPISDYENAIRDLLDDAVRRRMVADVPVGAFLSGGVDSSTVVALMQRHASGPVKTFSLGFDVGGAYNELSDARGVAQALGTQHHELHVSHEDLIGSISTLVHHYDEPFGDAAGLPILLLSRFAREHVKVVLAGDGADELFGGYRRYAADRFAPIYQRLPHRVTHRWLPGLVQRLPRLRRLKRSVQTLPIADPASRYANWLFYFTPAMQEELLCGAVSEAINDYDPAWAYPHYYDRTQLDPLNRLMYVDLKTWLVDTYMEKTDKASMAASLEVRLPFLDPHLVELAFQIPGPYKIHRGRTKHVLKEAVRSLIPTEVLRRPKHGFSVPTDPWFRGPLKSFAFEVLLDGRARQRGYLNREVIEKLWREHVEGRHVWNEHLWLLLNLELWQRAYIEVS